MARTNDNIILQKVSGNIGKQVVLKQVHGKTVLSKMPKKPAARSAKQQMCAQGFKLATAYAKSVMLNPELKALYSAEAKRRGVINAYNMALSDYKRCDSNRRGKRYICRWCVGVCYYSIERCCHR